MFLVVVLTVFAFQAFAQIDILTQGGPTAGDTETLVYKIFQMQSPGKIGAGSVLAIGLFGVTLLVTLCSSSSSSTGGCTMGTDAADRSRREAGMTAPCAPGVRPKSPAIRVLSDVGAARRRRAVPRLHDARARAVDAGRSTSTRAARPTPSPSSGTCSSGRTAPAASARRCCGAPSSR